jgi:hypothetical protein
VLELGEGLAQTFGPLGTTEENAFTRRSCPQLTHRLARQMDNGVEMFEPFEVRLRPPGRAAIGGLSVAPLEPNHSVSGNLQKGDQ